MSTIYDVAKIANVSIATVSRVINNSGPVALATRQRVVDAMDQLRFVPNAIARGLMIGSTNCIGTIVADITNPYYAESLRAIQDAADILGYTVICCNSDENIETEQRMISTLQKAQVDALILVGGRRTGSRHNAHLRHVAETTPVILCNESLDYENIYCVTCDKEKGAYEAVMHLRSLGHTRIALINGDKRFRPSVQKLAGYKRAMVDAGLAIEPGFIQSGDYHATGGAGCVDILLSLRKMPTAIIASNDLIALGAISRMATHGLKVPNDVSVVGFDGIDLGGYVTPKLTTVSQNIRLLGELSVEMFSLAIQQKAPKRTIIQPELIVRETCSNPKQ